MDKLYLDKTQTIIFYMVFKFCIKIIFWLIIYFFLLEVYDSRHTYMNMYSTEALTRGYETGWIDYKIFFKYWGIEIIVFISKCVFLKILSWILDNLSVPKSWLNYWNISSIMTRNICQQYRMYNYLSLKNLLLINKLSNIEIKNLKKIHSNQYLNDFFKKNDKNYSDDIDGIF